MTDQTEGSGPLRRSPTNLLPPAGWYAEPNGSSLFRWWDGFRWTTFTKSGAAAASGHNGRQSVRDGLALAGWWRRAVGWLLDALIVSFLTGLTHAHLMVYRATNLAATTALAHPSPLGAFRQSVEVLASLAIGLAYVVILFSWRGQTLGMMATGLRVVNLDGGKLRQGRIWKRVGTAYLLADAWFQTLYLLSLSKHGLEPLATVGGAILVVAFCVTLISYLWPLWNPLNQTLQDKSAGSVVVFAARVTGH